MVIPKVWVYLAACICFGVAAAQGKDGRIRMEWIGIAILVAAQL